MSSWSGSKLFDTLIVFLKDFFKEFILKKVVRWQQKHEKYLACIELKHQTIFKFCIYKKSNEPAHEILVFIELSSNKGIA